MTETEPGYPPGTDGEDIAVLARNLAAVHGRHIPLSVTMNFRDAGGYPVAGGGVIAWRTLLRSGALHSIDRGDADVLGSLGLRTILDLRTSAETQIAPSPLDDLAEVGAMTLHVSLIGEDLTGLPASLSEIYRFIVDERGAAIGAAVRSLARPGALPGLVHCTAGKDRTGIVVALVLAVAGVPDRYIAADYALSSLYLDQVRTPAIGRVRAGTGMGDRLTAALMASPPALILGVLDHARQLAGSVAGYLGSHGVTDADLGRLRAALVTDGARRA